MGSVMQQPAEDATITMGIWLNLDQLSYLEYSSLNFDTSRIYQVRSEYFTSSILDTLLQLNWSRAVAPGHSMYLIFECLSLKTACMGIVACERVGVIQFKVLYSITFVHSCIVYTYLTCLAKSALINIAPYLHKQWFFSLFISNVLPDISDEFAHKVVVNDFFC